MPYSHHSHSGQFCRHAKDQLEDIVKEAIKQGFEVYGLTEHAPRYRLEDLYPEESDLSLYDLKESYASFLQTAIGLKAKYSSQITLLIGIESDYITEIDLRRTLSLINSHKEIDYIVGSIHHVGGIPIDFDRATWLRAVYAAGRGEEGSMMSLKSDGSIHPTPLDTSIPQFQSDYTPSLGDLLPFILAYLDQQYHMIQSLRPEVIGHFDLFRLWTPDLDVRCTELNPGEGRSVWEAIDRNVREVIGYGGVFELNTAAFRKGWETAYPCRDIAEHIISLGGKFCFSDDSHGIAQVGLIYHRLKIYGQSLGLKEITYLTPSEDDGEVEEVSGDGRRPSRVISRTKKDIWGHPFWKSR